MTCHLGGGPLTRHNADNSN